MKNINTLNITNNILKKYNIKASKRYGQNFLIDDGILENIIQVSDIKKNELIIEIGPGLGNLTEYLLYNSTFCLLIELDSKMINVLNERFKDKYNNYILLNEDILKIDIDKVIEDIEQKNSIKYDNVKVIANLPYYITSPIIFKLLQDTKRVNEIVVMVQKELAQRIVAKNKSKDYGILTLMINYFAKSSIELIVPNTSFIPSPDVTSAVVKMVRDKRYNVSNEEMLFKLIHMSFAQRRKKVINSLVSMSFNDMNKVELERLFKECNISLNSRAEELVLSQYIQIVNCLEKKEGI